MIEIPAGHIPVFTDGSCDTRYLVGAWVAILVIAGQKIELSGIAKGTSHHRMELTAVIEAIRYIREEGHQDTPVIIYSDSQYVTGLVERQPKLEMQDFKTKSGKGTRNEDLVKIFYSVKQDLPLTFIKVKAHHKSDTPLLNIEADIKSRNRVRDEVKRII
jgi:ribonuclease HI